MGQQQTHEQIYTKKCIYNQRSNTVELREEMQGMERSSNASNIFFGFWFFVFTFCFFILSIRVVFFLNSGCLCALSCPLLLSLWLKSDNNYTLCQNALLIGNIPWHFVVVVVVVLLAYKRYRCGSDFLIVLGFVDQASPNDHDDTREEKIYIFKNFIIQTALNCTVCQYVYTLYIVIVDVVFFSV